LPPLDFLIFSFLSCSEIHKQSKIIKIVATSCQILKIKCTKFDFDWVSAPDPAGGAHRPLAEFKEPMFKRGNVFFSVLPALIMFCHSLKPTGIVITTEHSWMEKCTKFGQSILSKIIKIVATSCQIFRLICTKFDFGWGSAPDAPGGAHSAPPYPLAGFKGDYF